MIIFNILLTMGIFAVTLFLLIQYGGRHIQLSFAVLFIVTAILILGPIFFDVSEDLEIALPWVMFAWISSYLLSIPYQRRKAGKLVLTYKQGPWNMFWKLVTAASSVFLAYTLLRPGEYLLQNDIAEYFRIELPLGIVAVFLAIDHILTAFRKGEFRENGIFTPDLVYFLWGGYKAYEWVGYPQNSKKQFLLYLEGGRNETISIEYISEQDKNILEDLLSKKLPQVNPSS